MLLGRAEQFPKTPLEKQVFESTLGDGASFAMMEAIAILATLVRWADFEWDGQHAPEPISRVTLRPKGGMPLHVWPLEHTP